MEKVMKLRWEERMEKGDKERGKDLKVRQDDRMKYGWRNNEKPEGRVERPRSV